MKDWNIFDDSDNIFSFVADVGLMHDSHDVEENLFEKRNKINEDPIRKAVE